MHLTNPQKQGNEKLRCLSSIPLLLSEQTHTLPFPQVLFTGDHTLTL